MTVSVSRGCFRWEFDDSSNTLVVSSSGTIVDTISEMIESLDDAADSSSIVQVLHVDGTVDLGLIQERLKDLMKVTPASEQPGQQQSASPGSSLASSRGCHLGGKIRRRLSATEVGQQSSKLRKQFRFFNDT